MFVPLYDDNPHDPLFYPFVTRLLVVANVLIFTLFQSGLFFHSSREAIISFAIIPVLVTHEGAALIPQTIPPYLTFVTYMFLHGGWLHLIGNMLFLWVFGDNVEHAMGRLRFAFFYLASGVAGGFAHFLSDPTSDIPLVGASAAIAGIVAAYLMLFPYAKVWVLLLMRIPLRLSAIWVLGGWIVFQIFNVIVAIEDTTAWWAHIGGLIAGAALVTVLRRPDVPLFAKSVHTVVDVH